MCGFQNWLSSPHEWTNKQEPFNMRLSPCDDGGAYAAVLSKHRFKASEASGAKNLPGTSALSHSKGTGPITHLLFTMIFSLRFVERCWRPFILLLGSEYELEPRERAIMHLLDVEPVRVQPIFRGIPAADKLFAWKLTRYRRVVVLDSDMVILRSLDALFAPDAPELLMAPHTTDIYQAACGIPLGQRGIGAVLSIQPSLRRSDAIVPHEMT